jgi:hypothetical protein
MCFQKNMIEFWKENVICENDNIIWKLCMNACQGQRLGGDMRLTPRSYENDKLLAHCV